MRAILNSYMALLSILSPMWGVAQCNANKIGADDGAAVGGIFGAGSTGGGYIGLFGTAHSLNPLCAGGLMLELGYANNIARRGSDGILGITYDHTFNFTRNFEEPKRYALHPFLDVGYTRFFLGSNALHYGGGLLWHYSTIDERGFRLEYRGYSISGQSPISMTCSPGSAHNRVRFRIQEGAEDVEEQAQ